MRFDTIDGHVDHLPLPTPGLKEMPADIITWFLSAMAHQASDCMHAPHGLVGRQDVQCLPFSNIPVNSG